MRFATGARHLSDGELLRLLDDDGPGEELARLDAHVAICPRCGQGFRTLRQAALIVHERLEDLDDPATPPRASSAPIPLHRPVRAPVWTRTWARAAVLLLALAGALVTVAPLRARIVGWVAAAWGQLAGSQATAPAGPIPAVASAAPSSVLWFTPAGPQLRLVLSRRQAAGTLVLERAAGTSASLEVVPGGAGVVPLASERLLEIRNRADSRSSYVVRLPATTREVVLGIAGEPPRTIAAAALAAGVRVEVGAGAH